MKIRCWLAVFLFIPAVFSFSEINHSLHARFGYTKYKYIRSGLIYEITGDSGIFDPTFELETTAWESFYLFSHVNQEINLSGGLHIDVPINIFNIYYRFRVLGGLRMNFDFERIIEGGVNKLNIAPKIKLALLIEYRFIGVELSEEFIIYGDGFWNEFTPRLIFTINDRISLSFGVEWITGRLYDSPIPVNNYDIFFTVGVIF